MNLTKSIVTLSLLSSLALAGVSSTSAFASSSNYYNDHSSYSDDMQDDSEYTEDYSYDQEDHYSEEVGGNLVDKIVARADYSTLVAAVSAADLVSTLQGGDFTVLAPSNDAFAALPARTVETLVKPENKATLTKILLFHVIAGKVDLHSLDNGAKIKTVLGEELTLVNEGYGLQVIDGSGKSFDLTDEPTEGDNGYVYGLDAVLIPTL